MGSAVGAVRHAADDLLHQSLGRLSRVLPGPRADELDALRRQLADMDRTLAALVARQPAAADAAPAAPPPPPTENPTP